MTEVLLDLGSVGPGCRVLDIGSGIGQPALDAAGRVGPRGWVVGVDQAGEMLAVARHRAQVLGLTNVSFLEADAETLELPEEDPFDAVLARWSLMFLPDADVVLRAAYERLVPDGIIAAVVWGNPPQVPVLSMGFGIAAARLEMGPPPPGTPGPFSMANPTALFERFRSAGFTDVATEQHQLLFRLNSPEEFAEFSWDLMPPWLRSKFLERFGPDSDAELKQSIAKAGHQFQTSKGQLEIPCTTYSIRGARPS